DSPKADLMRPQWVFASRSYAFHPAGQIGMVALSRGAPLFEVRDLKRGGVTHHWRLQSGIARIDDPIAHRRTLAPLVSRPAAAPPIMRLASRKLAALSAPPPAEIEPRYISKGVVHEFRRPDRQPVYGIYYAPRNAKYRGPANVAPPALVLVHGGPTSMT